MGDVAGVAGVDNRAADGRPVQFLRVVNLVTARHAAGVKVGDVLVIVADRADDVALHNLHVINVIEQLDARRGDRLNHPDAERRVIAEIVFVIHFTVQQLDADGDAGVFGHLLDAVQAGDAVVEGFDL